MNRYGGILQRLVWFGLLAIVVLSPTQYSVEVAKKTFISLADPLVWGVFGLWVLTVLIQRWTPEALPASDCARDVKLRYPPLMVTLFILIAALSALRAIHPLKSVKDIIQWFEYFVLAFMLFANVSDRQRIRQLLDVFLVVAAGVVLVGCVQYVQPGIVDFKVRSTFGNRNVFGGYLALVVPLMAGVALYETRWWRKAGLLAMVTLALLVTLSGAAFLALALTLALLCMLRGKGAFAVFAVALCVIVLVILPRLPRHNDVTLDESLRLFNDKNEVALRYTEWQAAMIMTSENPWLGVGIGNYQDNIGGYFGVLPRPTGVGESDSENLYLVIVSSTGWLGLACFLGVLLTFGIMAARQFFTSTDPRHRGLALGLLGALLSYSICCIWNPLFVRGIGIPLAILCALTFLLDRVSDAEASPHVKQSQLE